MVECGIYFTSFCIGSGNIISGIENKDLWNESHEQEQMIINALSHEEGLTDKELAERLRTTGLTSRVCHQLCLQLAAKGIIRRERIQGKPLVNRIAKDEIYEPEQLILRLLSDEGGLTDKELADRLKEYGIVPYVCKNLCFQLANKGLIIRDKGRTPLVNRIIRGGKILY